MTDVGRSTYVGIFMVVALAAGVSEPIIALVVIAFGTSIPEIATCVTAARKSQGSLACRIRSIDN